MLPLQSAVGIVGLLGLAFLLSENKRHVPWRMVISGMALHFVLAALLIKVPAVQSGFGHLNNAVTGLTDGTTYGFRICAVDTAGNTGTGATVSATPQ